MKQQAIALTALTGLLLAAVPAPIIFAQAASASVRLSASRGQVEFLNSGTGHWERLRAPLNAAEGTAVRTAPGSEMQVTFADGSSMTLGEDSAMSFARLRQTGPNGEVGVRLMGQITANMSPTALQNTLTTVDMPVARATINRAFASARAVREEVAGALAVVKLQTPTGRAVRMAVSEGAATLQPLYNLTGVVTAVNVANNTFTLEDNRTGRARRVVVGATTLLATRDSTSAHVHRTAPDIMQAVALHSSIIVYGQPLPTEGPGDADDNRAVAAQVIFPQDPDADNLSAEAYVTENGTATPAAPAVPSLGNGLAVTAGHTGIVLAGDVIPAVVDGLQLSQVAPHLVGPGAGTVGAVAAPVIAGVVVVTAIGVAVVNNDHSHNNTFTPQSISSVPTTGTLNVTINRVLRSRIATRAAASFGESASTASVAPVGGAGIMAAASFHGLDVGPTVSTLADGTIVGRLPLGRRLQLHLGATQSHADMFSNMTTLDLGLDYSLSADRAIGLGVENRNYNVVDPLGNATTMSTFMPQLRYSLRY